MARTLSDRDIGPILDAARAWMDNCLVGDLSIFSSGALWTAECVAEARRAFVDHPDPGTDDFSTKLIRQMRGASADAQQLMAEMLWALFLFPSNMKVATKRTQVRHVWHLSGTEIADSHPLLDDTVLIGVGSGGPGFSAHRWRELVFLIALVTDLKARPRSDRRRLLTGYDEFLDWISGVRDCSHRQFRHMLRYFAFPDRVERISSNRDRRDILGGFGVAPDQETRGWSDRQLDKALTELRTKAEAEHPGVVLDFYQSPLRERWSRNGEPPPEDADDEPTSRNGEQPESSRALATNLILYGPPGTGKTHALRQMFEVYTDRPTAVDHETWLNELVANYGWRAIIASSLAKLGGRAKAPELRDHAWVKAKAKQRGRTSNVLATIWGCLQQHTPEDVTTVRFSGRRPPFVFTKGEDSSWALLPDWREADDEAAELHRLLDAGPNASGQPVKRYRVVTFHPSFSYEDFVRGIRPIAIDDSGTTAFRTVDGIFKQICDEARANPSKRYALFIDEINRANIAKVFGELITLIEPDKRAVYDEKGRLLSGMVVQLPGADGDEVTEAPFGVPANLDIYGTMNTADRSIALLDVALRRRFRFQELEPDYALLARSVESVDLSRLLRRINERLEYLLDRDHRIGHAYLISVQSISDLRAVFRDQVVPLLQEYFFDDLGRLAMVLGTARGAQPFVESRRSTAHELFSSQRSDAVPAERALFAVTEASSWTPESFRGIYEVSNSDDNQDA